MTSPTPANREKIPLNEVICGDCLDVMKQIPDNYFDLVLTDPPYGLPKSSTQGSGKLKHRVLNSGNVKQWDECPPQEYFDEMFRISKNQVIWGGNYFDLPPTRGIACWDKQQPWENFSAWEMAWTSLNLPAKIFRFRSMQEKKQHPTQKPLELMVWCLENYLKNDAGRRPRVFDGFAGSGTTGVACGKCQCDYLLVEKEQQYCDIARNRLKQQTLL